MCASVALSLKKRAPPDDATHIAIGTATVGQSTAHTYRASTHIGCACADVTLLRSSQDTHVTMRASVALSFKKRAPLDDATHTAIGTAAVGQSTSHTYRAVVHDCPGINCCWPIPATVISHGIVPAM